VSELVAKGDLIRPPELIDYARVVYLPETAASKAGSAMKTMWRWATRYLGTNSSTVGVLCAKSNLERRAADVEVQIGAGSYTDSLKLLEEVAEGMASITRHYAQPRLHQFRTLLSLKSKDMLVFCSFHAFTIPVLIIFRRMQRRH